MSGDIGSMPPGSVIITPTQMYSEIRVMAGKVDHLAAVLDPALSDIRADVAEGKVERRALSERIAAVEKRMWVASGFALAGGAGLAQLVTYIGG